MKKIFVITIVFSLFFVFACKQSTTTGSKPIVNSIENTNLNPKDFQDKIKTDQNAIVLDVRTPEEYREGHLENAQNIDFSESSFQTNIEKLDKTKPVYVYCLSGGRSKRAAEVMRNAGFSKVYELEGGMMSWRSENLPETSDSTILKNENKGMSLQDFQGAITSDKIVLVDFYADWCEPCKKMKPYIDEISTTMQESVKVVRINADENKELCKELKINALPVLQVYKNQKMEWQNLGFVKKETVLEKLK